MTDEVKRAEYLAGESAGDDLTPSEREALDRIGGHLEDADVWEPPSADGQFRLLAAAAAEAANAARNQTENQAQPRPTPVTTDRTSGRNPVEDEAPRTSENHGNKAGGEHEVVAPVIGIDRKRRTRQRALGFGAGVALAGAAALALVTTGQVAIDQTEETEARVTASYELAATPLDPDTIATVDVAPTPSGVEFRLHLKGLDNPEGDGYYAAWLMGPDEAISLGTFHWKKGGTTIVLWSGIDDPAYNRFMVTRQTRGDGGLRSDEVVLVGEVTDLRADE